MTRAISLFRNLSSNLLGYVVNALVAFFLSPFVVHSLGDNAYGLWSLVIAFVGYYGLLDLGIRSAVGHYVTRYWSSGDVAGVGRTLSTAVCLTLIVCIVIVGVTFLAAARAPDWFDLEPRQTEDARQLILIMGLAQCLLLPLALAGVATYARKRFDLANAIGIPSRLLTAGLTVWALKMGHGLIGLALVTVGVAVLAGLARLVVAIYLLPGVKISFRSVGRNSVKELAGYGLWNSLVNVAERVLTYTDSIVIGAFMSTVAVTYYAIAGNLIPYYIALINSISWVIAPYVTAFDAQGDLASLRRFWISGTRWVFTAAGLVGGGLIFFGTDFLSLWMGDRFVSGDEYTSSGVILIILAVATLARLGMSCGRQICFGMREVRFLGILSLVEAGANIVISVLLVRPLGMIGVALGSLIPVLVLYLGVLPGFVCRKLGLDLSGFWKSSSATVIVLLSSMGVFSLLATRIMTVNSWTELIVKAAAVTVPSLAVGLVLGTNSDAKQELLGLLRRASGTAFRSKS